MRMSGVLASCRRGLVATLCLFCLFSLPAQAVNVSVDGTVYNVQLLAGPATYFDNRGTLIPAPWWGNATHAEEAALNFHTATGGVYGFTNVLFVYNESGPLNSDTVDTYLAGNPPLHLTDVANLAADSGAAFAFVAPAAVPEIDGNALPKALFVLFTLYVWLQVRRNRRVA